MRENIFFNIDIDEFINALEIENIYNNFSDKHTKNLVSNFPENAKSWVGARKKFKFVFKRSLRNTLILTLATMKILNAPKFLI